jgi:hypothetical protein
MYASFAQYVGAVTLNDEAIDKHKKDSITKKGEVRNTSIFINIDYKGVCMYIPIYVYLCIA